MNLPSRLLVIAHPAAGNDFSAVEHVEAALQKYNLEYDVTLVNTPRDAAEATKNGLHRKYSAVAVFGGDSTAAAVITQLSDSKIPLLILPGGTSNIIAKAMAAPRNIERYIRAFVENRYVLRYLQLADADGRPLVLDFHFGLFSRSVRTTPRLLKRILGSHAYQISAIRQAMHAKKYRFKLNIDGKIIEEYAYACLVINAGQKTVFGIHIWPRRKPGYLRIMIVRRKDVLSLVRWFLARFFGRANAQHIVATWYAETVTFVKTPKTMLFDDQPLKATLPMTAELALHFVTVVSPVVPRSNIRTYLRWLQVSTYLYVDQLQRLFTGIPSGRFSQISRQLYIGGQYDARALTYFEQRGITGVVNMRTKNKVDLPKSSKLKVLHLPTTDLTAPSMKNLEKGVAFIQDHINTGGAVYVHCRLGQGRGPTMAAAYLITTGMRPEDAIAHLQRYRPFAQPNKTQQKRLVEFARRVERKAAK